MSFNMNELNDPEVGHYTGGRVIAEPGDHNVMISEASIERNKKNNGDNLVMKYTILDGVSSGVEVTEYLAVVHENDTAQSIARSRLKTIRDIVKAQKAADIKALEGKQLRIRVIHEKNEYVDRNGNKRTGTNAQVANYADTKGLDVNGKPLPAFIQTAKQDDVKPKEDDRKQSQTQDTSYDDDDDIPF